MQNYKLKKDNFKTSKNAFKVVRLIGMSKEVMCPIFHWKPERIKAHISICYLAFALGKFSIEKMKSQGLQLSFDKLRTEFSEIESSILMDQSGNGKQLYLLPSPLNASHGPFNAKYHSLLNTRSDLL